MNFESILQKSESQTIEFKDSFDRETLETAVAFSNTKGGTSGTRVDCHLK